MSFIDIGQQIFDQMVSIMSDRFSLRVVASFLDTMPLLCCHVETAIFPPHNNALIFQPRNNSTQKSLLL